MNLLHSRKLLAAAVAGAVGTLAPLANAATAPFAETFDGAATGSTLPAGFIESGPAVPAGGAADYTIEPDAPSGNDLQALISATTAATGTGGVAANRSAAVAFPALTSGQFSITSEFTLDSFQGGGSASTINFGLAARGTDSNFSSGNNYRLLYTPFVSGGAGNTGRLTLTENNGANLTAAPGGTLTSTGTLAPTAGLSGTLTLTGTESGGTITLTGTLVSGATTLTVSGTDTSITAGQFFGYRTALNAQNSATDTGALTSSENVDYDNLNVVPEPTSLGLLGVSGLLLLGRRRRA